MNHDRSGWADRRPAAIPTSGPDKMRPAGPGQLSLPQYHLWTTDQRAINRYWVAASSEDVARRLVMLNADPQAEDARIWHCRRSRERRAPEGLIVTGLSDPIVIVKR